MIYNEIIKEGDRLCFDVGANIGNRTSMFLDIGYKKVILFEPQIECVSMLKQRFGNEDRTFLVEKALSDKEGVEKIYISNAHTISSMDEEFIREVKKERFKDYTWSSFYEVETTTLDKMIGEFGTPDFIKIDVEGHELKVIGGLSIPINNISFEYTPELHSKAVMCVKKLESVSSYIYNFSLGESLSFYLDEWTDFETLGSILEKMRDKKDDRGDLIFGDIYAKRIL